MHAVFKFLFLFTVGLNHIACRMRKDQILRILSKVDSIDDFREHFNLTKQAHRRSSVNKKELNAYSNAPVIKFENASLIKCEPRPKIIEIPNANRVLYAYYPECIRVNQCSGCCPLERQCVKNSTSPKAVYVYRASFLDGSVVSHRVDYIEDDSCQCECKTKASDCTGQRTYDENSCKCVCGTKPLQCPAKKQWSDLDCDCICSKVDSCVGPNYTWNNSTCQCECPQRSCPTGMKFDPAVCACLST